MSDFQRYAVFHLPDDPDLAAFGASWLGWDVVSGRTCAQPDVEGIRSATDAPRRYGFHGTLKPPFRLANRMTADDLAGDVAALAARTAPVRLPGMALARIGQFLALVPTGDTAALGELAFDCISTLDHYRRPADPAELTRRRAANLTPRQDELLVQWGYPYVAEEFRFHLTLTGKIAAEDQNRLLRALSDHIPKLPGPFDIASICLVGEGTDGRCRMIHRYALTG